MLDQPHCLTINLPLIEWLLYVPGPVLSDLQVLTLLTLSKPCEA